MQLIISNADDRPIYEQICQQIKSQILSGELQPGQLLPSIRALAKDLRISFITTKRAYEELEKEGFIYTIQAKGCYVAPKNTALLREEGLKKIEAHMEQIAQLATACNLTKADIIEMITFSLEDTL